MKHKYWVRKEFLRINKPHPFRYNPDDYVEVEVEYEEDCGWPKTGVDDRACRAVIHWAKTIERPPEPPSQPAGGPQSRNPCQCMTECLLALVGLIQKKEETTDKKGGITDETA